MQGLPRSATYIGRTAPNEKGPVAGNAASPDDIARRKERVALWSIVATVLITAGKGFGGFLTGSLALISDAAQSLLDIVTTSLTWFAIRSAHKPADAEHHYGHGKFESLAALVETAFLLILSGAVALEGVRRLTTAPAEVDPSWIAAAILVVSIGIDGWRWWVLKTTAAETGSEALEADALHFSSDLVNSILVLAALGAAALGYPKADAVIAILVAVFIAWAGFRLARRTVDTLLDTAPKGLAERVGTIAGGVAGVVAVDRVRIRPAGGLVIGEVTVRVSRSLPLERVTEIKARIQEGLSQDLPRSEFTITADPIQLDNETILERVMLIAARLRVPIHHVIVQNVGDRLSISFDVEVDSQMSLGEAHAIASRVEHAIRQELGERVEVESHIEPLVANELAGREADAATIATIAASLAGGAAAVTDIDDVHNVRVRHTQAGLIVNFHCGIDPAADVAHVHEIVDRLERHVRALNPAVLRIIGHAEPKRDAAEPAGAAGIGPRPLPVE